MPGFCWAGRQWAFRQRDRKALLGGGGRLDGVAEFHGGEIVLEAAPIRKPKAIAPWPAPDTRSRLEGDLGPQARHGTDEPRVLLSLEHRADGLVGLRCFFNAPLLATASPCVATMSPRAPRLRGGSPARHRPRRPRVHRRANAQPQRRAIAARPSAPAAARPAAGWWHLCRRGTDPNQPCQPHLADCLTSRVKSLYICTLSLAFAIGPMSFRHRPMR